MYVSMCIQDDSKPDSNSSGMGSGAASSSAGSPASKPNTTSNTDYQQESISSPASIHVAVCIIVQLVDIACRRLLLNFLQGSAHLKEKNVKINSLQLNRIFFVGKSYLPVWYLS